jgi:ABC-2 type transport system ATP-binding protein
LRLADYAELESMLAALREARITIIELSLQEADLEQVFLRIMARQE